MSATEKAALLRSMKCSRSGPDCATPEHCAAIEAAAMAIEAAEALRPWLAMLADSTSVTIERNRASVTDHVNDAEREAARRLLAVIGGES